MLRMTKAERWAGAPKDSLTCIDCEGPARNLASLETFVDEDLFILCDDCRAKRILENVSIRLQRSEVPQARHPVDLQKIFLVAGSVFLVLCFGGYAAGWDNTFKTSLLAAAFYCAAAIASGWIKGLL